MAVDVAAAAADVGAGQDAGGICLVRVLGGGKCCGPVAISVVDAAAAAAVASVVVGGV